MGLKIWRLLHEWRTPPGSQTDGSFKETQFSSWMQHVKMSCTESGHWEAAQTNIGAVLIYCPKDQNGLWINKIVANALNFDDAKDMRDGFKTAFFNSRGAHWVDPTGKQEKELADNYRQKANDIEKVGCYRLAVTLRELAEDYDREADQNLEEHNRRVTLEETN